MDDLKQPKHTPGPWHVGPHYKSDVESSQGRICEAVPLGSDRAAANARMIAAAPEMYEALKELAWMLPPVDAPCHLGITTQDKCGHCGRIKRALDAIAKAEGK